MASKRLRCALWLVMLVCLAASAPLARAANNCPWMNEATAGGLLGGASTGAFTAAANGQPAVCTFTSTTPDATRVLEVTVEVVSSEPHLRLAQLEDACRMNTAPVPAVGNEAMRCQPKVRGAVMAERILGRVRDQVFSITISTSLKDDGELNADMLEKHLALAAEQVAGNLF